MVTSLVAYDLFIKRRRGQRAKPEFSERQCRVIWSFPLYREAKVTDVIGLLAGADACPPIKLLMGICHRPWNARSVFRPTAFRSLRVKSHSHIRNHNHAGAEQGPEPLRNKRGLAGDLRT